MKKILLGMAVTGFMFSAFYGCSKKNEAADETAVIYENIKAAEAKDVKGFMDTIHEASPVRAKTEKAVAELFKNYDIKYELSDVKITEKSEDMLKVGYTQITRIGPPISRNSRAEGIHYLKKSSDGKWKIFFSEIRKAEVIN